MRRSKTVSLSEALNDYIKEMNIGGKLGEAEVLDSWNSIMGKAIATRTSKIYFRDGILYVHLTSSVVRNELSMIREAIREKLNSAAGKEVVKDIILR